MEAKIAHLQMIQAAIERLSTNSFLVKGWSVTLVSALFALATLEANRAFLALTYFPVFAFWALDAYFLRQEKLFRKLHDHVRQRAEENVDFSMDTSDFQGKVSSELKIAFSKTLRLFHGVVAVAVLVVMFFLRGGNG